MQRTRRDLLASLGAAGLVGCGPGQAPGVSRPFGASPATPTTTPPGDIGTIVLCMMENRSFDHVFGSYSLLEGRAVDGLRAGMGNPDRDGRFHEVVPSTLPCTEPDPPHGWSTSRQQFAEGTNLGFIDAYLTRSGSFDLTQCIAYQSRAQQPVSYALADAFGLADRWFSSVLTSTWPNRLYFHAAQSMGVPDNTLPVGAFSCRTIWDQLTEAGIDWAYYFTDLPTLALFGRSEWAPHVRFIDAFYEDAANGTLPPVVCVDAGANFNDDHPPHHPLLGQLFIGSVAQALMDSPQWEESLFICTYDEAGGFFDHVPPPRFPDDYAAQGFDQAGFRVPAMVVGPWVKQGHLSSRVFDHTAALAFVREWFGIDEALTARDAAAASLSEFLDLDRMAANLPRSPIQLPTISLSEAEIEAQCERRGWRNGQPELQQVVRERFPLWDRSDPVSSRSAARSFFRRVGEQGLWVPA